MSTRDQTLLKVKSVLTGMFEVPGDKVVPEAHLYRDLGLDSLDAIDLAVRLKTETGLELSEQELRSIRTVADIVNVIDARLKQRPMDES